MKKLLATLALLALCSVAMAQATRTIIFEDPNARANIKEYVLYIGTTSGGPYNTITPVRIPMPDPLPPEGQDVTLSAEIAVPGPGTYYAVVTAVNFIDLESGNSNEASTVITEDELRPLTMINVRIVTP